MTNHTQQTASNNLDFSFTLSNISPPVFVQPLPHLIPIPPTQQETVNPLPHVSLHTFQMEGFTAPNTSTSAEDPPTYPTFNLDLITEDLGNTPSSGTDLYDSPMDQPLSSAFPSETSSALASDSDLPPPSSIVATKQTGLFDFFSKIPPGESHARWQKRKRDNEDRDQNEYEERKKKGEAEKLQKLTNKRTRNRVSQAKHRLRNQKDKAKLQVDIGQDSSVGFFDVL